MMLQASDYRGSEGLLRWSLDPQVVDYVNFTIRARVKIAGMVAGEPVKFELERQFFYDQTAPFQPEPNWREQVQTRVYMLAKAWIDALVEQYRAGTFTIDTTSEAFNTWVAGPPLEPDRRLAQDMLYL